VRGDLNLRPVQWFRLWRANLTGGKPSLNANPTPTRPGWAEERRGRRIKILDVRRRRSRQVSKISVCSEHRKVPGAKRRDPDCGSPSLCLLSLGEARESESPAAATERLRNVAKNLVMDSTQGFDRLSPNGLGSEGFDTLAYPVLRYRRVSPNGGRWAVSGGRSFYKPETNAATPNNQVHWQKNKETKP
jgi:hypothetical protein